jgi:hypothetical protein
MTPSGERAPRPHAVAQKERAGARQGAVPARRVARSIPLGGEFRAGVVAEIDLGVSICIDETQFTGKGKPAQPRTHDGNDTDNRGSVLVTSACALRLEVTFTPRDGSQYGSRLRKMGPCPVSNAENGNYHRQMIFALPCVAMYAEAASDS